MPTVKFGSLLVLIKFPKEQNTLGQTESWKQAHGQRKEWWGQLDISRKQVPPPHVESKTKR